MRSLFFYIALVFITLNAQSQPFKMDNVVFENIVFEDTVANQIYLETDKETRYNELIQILPQYFNNVSITDQDEIALTLLLAYSYYYQDEYYDALKFNRMAAKDLGKKKTGPLFLANKTLSVLIFDKYGDVLSAEKNLQGITSERAITQYQLKVFAADLNERKKDFSKAFDLYLEAADHATSISKFDHFYVNYKISTLAEYLGKNPEHLTYAIRTDSILKAKRTDNFSSNLIYLIPTTKAFLDSMQNLASLNLISALRKNNKPQEALNLIEVLIHEKTATGEKAILAQLLQHKGTTLTLTQKYAEAGSVLNDALKLYNELENDSRISETYNLEAKNYFLEKDYGRVIDRAENAVDYAKQSSDLNNLAAAYLILSETYGISNDYINSQRYFKLYTATKENIEKLNDPGNSKLVQKQTEIKLILQKIEAEIIENELREIELINAKITAEQKEQENIFLKQQNELREKDLLNKQLEKEQIQRNLQLIREQLEKEQLQKKIIQEENDKEKRIAENKSNLDKLELLNTQKEAADKENKLNLLELKTSQNRQMTFMIIMFLLAIFLAFMIYFIFRFRKQNKIIAGNIQTINKTNAELVGTIEQVNIQKALIEAKNEEITDSIAYAKRIQNAILPNENSIAGHLGENFIIYKPKDIVAGDFYWIAQSDEAVLFAVADCTGHGVPGAMVSVVCHSALTRSVREFKLQKPSDILDKVRELVLETFEKSGEGVNDGMDIALCLLDVKSGNLQYSGANNSIFIIRDEELLEIKSDKQPIGKFAYAKPFTNHEVNLVHGDQLYLFSDGFADQFGGEKGKKLKTQTFKDMLLKHRSEPMDLQKKALEGYFDQWRGELEQIDDVCVMGIRFSSN